MKTTFDYFKYLFLCIVVCAFTACSDDDDEGNSSAVIEIADQYKTITCTGADNDAIEITFTAKNDWTALPSHSWIDLSKRSGSAGDQTIIVSIDDNEEFKTRIGTITLKDKVSGKTVDITVTQGEKNSYFTFTSVKGESKENGILIINNEQQMITDTVNIASNYEYSVAVDVNWLSYKKVNTNADGSAKYVFYADPAKLYEAAGYKEQTATVSFEYQAATRVPATKKYQVKFAGVTPQIVFYTSSESTSAAELVDDLGDGIYKATINVKSNIAFSINNSSDYSTYEINGDGNKSKDYFQTETSINIMLKDGKLDTEDLNNGKVEFVSEHDATMVIGSLPVVVKGVGDDYIYIDETSFIEAGKDQMTNTYMFPAEGNAEGMPFKVRASHLDDVIFYMALMEAPMGYPSIVIAKDMQNAWPQFGGIEAATPLCRSAVETGNYIVWNSPRNEMESMAGGDPSANRFIALFAVSKNKYPDFDSMFDFPVDDPDNYLDATLKPELEGSYIVLGQKGMEKHYNFYSEQLPTNGTVIEVPAEGGSITIDYEVETDMISMYNNVEWFDESDPYDWKGDGMWEEKNLSVKYTSGLPQMVITVTEATQTREFNCGIAAYVEGRDNDYMLRTFTIKQVVK